MDADNPFYSSFNGMLFERSTDESAPNDYARLTLVPEGFEGNAVLPVAVASVPACVFSRCTELSAISFSQGSAAISAFASQDGLLYTSDLSVLLAAPAGIGASAVLAPECVSIAEGAFWGNAALRTIIARGTVSDIFVGTSTEQGATVSAFMDEVIGAATVVLPDDASRAAWEAVGFTHFDVPVQVGDIIAPQNAGYAFQVLPDYTLAVSWHGAEATAPALVSIPDFGLVRGTAYTISAVADGGFAGQTGIQAVVLPAKLTTLGVRAFAGCAQLASIQMGNAITRLPEGVLEGTALTSLVLSANVQAVDARALADLDGTSIVTLGTVPQVDPNALQGATDVSVYAPYSADAPAWNTGLPTSGNHVLPYGVRFASGISQLEVGDTVEMFEGDGYLYAPGNVHANVSYDASCISVDTDANTITAKRDGSFKVSVDLAITVAEAQPTGTAYREIELKPASLGAADQSATQPQPVGTIHRSVRALGETLTGNVTAPQADDMISVTLPISVVFGDDEGVQVPATGTYAEPIITQSYIRNNAAPVTLTALACSAYQADDQAAADPVARILQPVGSIALPDQTDLFSFWATNEAESASANKATFGYGASTGTAAALPSIAIDAATAEQPAVLDCWYSLNLGAKAAIKSRSDLADEGINVSESDKPVHQLATLKLTFQRANQGGGA